MQKPIAGALAIIVVLSGAQAGWALPGARSASGRTTAVPVPAPAVLPAAVPQDGPGGIVRKGPLITIGRQTSVTVYVLGSHDIFLAGQPDLFKLAGRSGSDQAPKNTPQSVRVTALGGQPVTFAATGASILGGAGPRPRTADGSGTYITTGPVTTHAGSLALSGVTAPSGSLVGVFTGSSRPQGTPPQPLNFKDARLRDSLSLRPKLNQVFYIGQGVTSKGARKQFLIPPGAARLFLGILASIGSNHGASGRIAAIVTGTSRTGSSFEPIPPTPTDTPSDTPTKTATITPPPTVTGTGVPAAATVTQTATITPFPTDTVTDTPLPTNTLVPTFTQTLTPTLTATPTLTQTLTPTLTATPTNTVTLTPSPTITLSPTPFVFPR